MAENSTILYGTLRDRTEKDDLQYCESLGYQCMPIEDARDTLQALLTSVSNEIDLLPGEQRASLASKLAKTTSRCGIKT